MWLQSRWCSWHGSQQLQTAEQQDRNNSAAAQQQAAAVLCSNQVASSRQASVCRPAAHVWDPVSQKQISSTAMAAEHEDRNNSVAAQFKEQQRPLGRSKEPRSWRLSGFGVPVISTSTVVLCLCSCCLCAQFISNCIGLHHNRALLLLLSGWAGHNVPSSDNQNRPVSRPSILTDFNAFVLCSNCATGI